MSITAVNAIYQGIGAGGYGNASVQVAPSSFAGDAAGDAAIFQSIVAGAMGGDLQGFCLPVLDGSATTFSLQWIDGTATLQYPPSGVFLFRADPPAWTASTFYPVNAIALGSAHVQQVTKAGKSSTAAPTWKTDGTSVTETNGPTWKDLGALGLSTISATTATAVTNLACTVTISAAGTSTQVIPIWFRMAR